MHTIRLRGPWEIERREDAVGTFRCVRHFNKPTGLEGGERVWLAIERCSGPASVSLNGGGVGQAFRLSPGDAPVRFDITRLLQPRNKLVIEVVCPAQCDAADCLGAVCLEIE